MPFVPTFGAKLHELVSSGHDCIGWSEDGTHVWVTNPERLARDVIPRFFGHCSYPSLSRSLHAHSFTISPGSNNTWHHMSFRRDAPALAKTIMRKRPKPNERRRPEAPQDPHVSRAPNAESALARLCEELREEEQAGETLMLTLERTLGCGRPLGHTGPCGSAVLIGKRARVLTAKAREAMAGDSE
ncbi:hypothetical protein EMIHUDRAFT_248778 [Emiliania huxleyi CCMP1516]|uniref:HSF-type DNA-binding domain-containing protein n=2 Tax=Emiliania huxleyi TaxID=2903 RepID=A0A0D3ID28_EMIH1|nr:hypothetical protein EMIHUDRAFT_248778 [Emiliania huxleyi CCMP1516]EOD09163.1 hypothetical protein EMIHUDRAFT_248778 [Emiliania huxleyi CCMP1516]|eukprot:XP_005761592.1 hypothetical protein EMIHUDRAFT_248778 [Emiliania huxleyi CCMP1516]